jgi:hypothetical protein
MIIEATTMITEIVIEIGLGSRADLGQEVENERIIDTTEITVIVTTIGIEIMKEVGTIRFADLVRIAMINKLVGVIVVTQPQIQGINVTLMISDKFIIVKRTENKKSKESLLKTDN